MSKRVKVVISTLVVVLLLTVGSTVTVVAQEEPEEELTPPVLQAEAGCFLTRVAEILEIDEEDLANAFKQARQEMIEVQQQRREEACIRALQRAVERGCITREHADEIEEWWGQKPEGVGLHQRARILSAVCRRRVAGAFRGGGGPRLPKSAD